MTIQRDASHVMESPLAYCEEVDGAADTCGESCCTRVKNWVAGNCTYLPANALTCRVYTCLLSRHGVRIATRTNLLRHYSETVLVAVARLDNSLRYSNCTQIPVQRYVEEWKTLHSDTTLSTECYVYKGNAVVL